MKQFYIKSVVLLILLIITIKIIDQLIVHEELLHYTNSKVFESGEDIDFMMFGNSLSQRSYNSEIIDSVFNSNSICLGSSAQQFLITNEIIKKVVRTKKSHPKKLLVINISPNQFRTTGGDTWSFLQQAALDEVDYSSDYFNILSTLFEPKDYPKALSSTIRFHKNLGEEIGSSQSTLEYYKEIDADGFSFNDEHILSYSQKIGKKDFLKKAEQFKNEVITSKVTSLGIKNEKILLNIIKECKRNKIKYLFLTPPAINMVYNSEDYGKFRYLEQLFNSQNAPYLNTNQYIENIGLTLEDYSDYSHLNKEGSKKFTNFLVTYLKRAFNLQPNIDTYNNEKVILPTKGEVIYVAKATDLLKIHSNFEQTQDSLENGAIYKLERNSITHPSYLSNKPLRIDPNKYYRATILVKKAKNSDLFALRLQSTYPNRVDAVFDLKKNKLKEVLTYTDKFTFSKAQIQDLDNGWYRCTVSVSINDTRLSIILGPSESNTKSPIWEAATPIKNDVYIIPSSLTIEKYE
ncbi:hypothetical protein [Nonlabens sp. Asnod2-A12]|uniref:hypothetical protein n=1 Tax=Nonlabens sp. Asnod2-A12 TaxID=3160578 RepID=UPI00386420E0